MLADFEDTEEGGFFFTSDSHESLLARHKDPFDRALPSGNSLAIVDLIALSRTTRNPTYRDHAGKALAAFGAVLAESPAAMPLGLVGLSQYFDSAAAPGTPKPAGDLVVEAPSQQTVTASASVRTTGDPGRPIAPGREFDASVSIMIQKGWHIYANPTGLAEMRPTHARARFFSRKGCDPDQGFLPSRQGPSR